MADCITAVFGRFAGRPQYIRPIVEEWLENPSFFIWENDEFKHVYREKSEANYPDSWLFRIGVPEDVNKEFCWVFDYDYDAELSKASETNEQLEAESAHEAKADPERVEAIQGQNYVGVESNKDIFWEQVRSTAKKLKKAQPLLTKTKIATMLRDEAIKKSTPKKRSPLADYQVSYIVKKLKGIGKRGAPPKANNAIL
jgi:hypothetical protein